MPKLIIIAGCNGTGKSTFASSFLPEGLTSFDYDRVLIENYNSLPDGEFREKVAKNNTTKEFEYAIKKLRQTKQTFVMKLILTPIQLIGLKILEKKVIKLI